jgi:hypothetical protein
MEKYNVCRNTSMDSKLVKAYHAMFRTGHHGVEEGSDILILPIQMVQVSFASITRFLDPGSTTPRHGN